MIKEHRISECDEMWKVQGRISCDAAYNQDVRGNACVHNNICDNDVLPVVIGIVM
jgi:hypothetical protein